MKFSITPALLFASAVSFSWTVQAQGQSIQAGLDEVRSEFERAFNSGNATELANVFSEDAVVMPPNFERLEGRAAIETGFDTHIFGQLQAADLQINTEEIQQIDGAAYDTGTYSMNVQGPGGEISVGGDYMVLVERNADGNWKVTRQIWNIDQPAAAR